MKKKILIATLTLTVLVGSVVACNKNNDEGIMRNEEVVNMNNNVDNTTVDDVESNEEVEVEETEAPEETELPIDNSQLEIETEPVEPTTAPEETEIPEETNTPAPTELPIDNSELPIETEVPKPTAEPTAVPTKAPEVTTVPEVTAEPVVTEAPKPVVTATPAPTPVPTPEPTVTPTPTPEPVVEECQHAGLQLTGRVWKEEEWSVGRCHETLVYFETVCTQCGEKFEDPTPCGMNPEHPATENPGSYGPTCTTEGYYAGAQCDCGQAKAEPYTIPAAGHRYEITQLENVFHHGEELYPDDPALAAQSGWTEYHYEEKCRICGDVTRNWWSTDATEAW